MKLRFLPLPMLAANPANQGLLDAITAAIRLPRKCSTCGRFVRPPVRA